MQEYYPDPEKFDIDRYQKPRAEHLKPGVFSPYGRGPHVCLGKTLAEVQMSLTMARLFYLLDLGLEPAERDRGEAPQRAVIRSGLAGVAHPELDVVDAVEWQEVGGLLVSSRVDPGARPDVWEDKRLADHEWYAAEFYEKRGHLAGAAGRLETLVRDYPGSPRAPEALLRLAGIYLKQDERYRAQQALQQFIVKHPDDPRRPEAEKQLASLR